MKTSQAVITADILEKLSNGESVTINLPPNCSKLILSLEKDEDLGEKFKEMFFEFSKAVQKTFKKNGGLRR